MQGKSRWIITLLGRRLNAGHIADVTREVSAQGLNIENIKRLTGRVPVNSEPSPLSKTCIEMAVRGNPADRNELQRRFLEISSAQEVDISFQEDNIFRRSRRLICFDMDSTLIETEVIDELAVRAGVGDQVKAITDRGHARRNRLLRKFPRTGGSAQRTRRERHAGHCRTPPHHRRARGG